MELKILLNGTDTNPWHKLGLSQNPFPQTAKYELDAACLHIQALGGDPIPDVAYIRNHLRGYSEELVELCCSQFRRGEMVEFTVTWENRDDQSA